MSTRKRILSGGLLPITMPMLLILVADLLLALTVMVYAIG